MNGNCTVLGLMYCLDNNGHRCFLNNGQYGNSCITPQSSNSWAMLALRVEVDRHLSEFTFIPIKLYWSEQSIVLFVVIQFALRQAKSFKTRANHRRPCQKLKCLFTTVASRRQSEKSVTLMMSRYSAILHYITLYALPWHSTLPALWLVVTTCCQLYTPSLCRQILCRLLQ